MNRVLILLMLGLTVACQRGANVMAHNGVCDMYSTSEDSLYILPYASGTTHRVTQGNCHPITHFGPQRYAYDFSMNNDTEILAARGGEVIAVKEDHPNQVGTCEDNNHIRIKHEDGTVSDYLHLTQDGALVEIGDQVNQGDVVALSGVSGCTTGVPHLHFVVWIDDWHKWGRGRDSIPVVFRNAFPSRDWGLSTGDEYEATEDQ